MYYKGLGVKKDFSKAKEWFLKGANQNNSDAQYNLGYMYYHGVGVRENKITVKEWYGKSCDNGLQLGCEQYAKLHLD